MLLLKKIGKIIGQPIGFALLGLVLQQCSSNRRIEHKNIKVNVNPYEKVSWSSVQRYKAALHLHTLQSDGYNSVKEVVDTYQRQGFKIIGITDHDWNYPNARIKWGQVSEEKASPFPEDPKPDNFPANTTWPWIDYGTPSPDSLKIIGIQAAELTFRHHINSYFSDYGVWYERTGSKAPYSGIEDNLGNVIFEDEQIFAVKRKKGLAILNHPDISDSKSWWERKPLEWYVQRFRNSSPEVLVGMEVTNMQNKEVIDGTAKALKYNESLWDQLLIRFMPSRPIWGFGADDMHSLDNVMDSFTVFLLDEFSENAVYNAMLNGQFYFCYSTRIINMLKDDPSLFPSIDKIEVDSKEANITISASNYDEIVWISGPEILQPIANYKTSNQPWDSGKVVGKGRMIELRGSDIKNYVRAELIRTSGNDIYRTFTNPFGVGASD